LVGLADLVHRVPDLVSPAHLTDATLIANIRAPPPQNLSEEGGLIAYLEQVLSELS